MDHELDNYEMTQREAAVALNEWRRRSIEEPDRFLSESETIAQFVEQDAAGTPEYGASGLAYMLKIHRELTT
ncbi:hypothetical protein U1872_06150 [Sphingomonas sp. RB3P16]|uniref:hypothetical protein n=1 Tax=Parasphingomonas frigoris TaxID=3096163 RepID=UPI002FC8EFB2